MGVRPSMSPFNIPQVEKTSLFYWSLNFLSDKIIFKVKINNLGEAREFKGSQMKHLEEFV